MIRRIIEINKEKCNGCGKCITACQEGAIKLIDGKAELTRDDYCDGLGDCLPNCPTGAITFVEREALPYDEEAVNKNKQYNVNCLGNQEKILKEENPNEKMIKTTSKLNQWPVQIKLVSPNSSYFNGAKLLIAADCTAYAYANFHNDFIKDNITLIGCPKLDSVDYTEKLTEILKNNDIKKVTVVRMEVPCCGGIENATKNALIASRKYIQWQVVTISTTGEIIE